MNEDIFDIPLDQVEQIKSAMDGEAIRLPFTAPVLWWMNGSQKEKRNGGVPYMGGWASSAEEFQVAADEFGGIPPQFSPHTMTNDEGKDYDIFCTRSVGFALIAKRSRWVIDEQTQRGRGHVQYLGIAAYKDGENVKPWGPVVLSAKGMSAKYLGDAFAKFERATTKARREFAKNLPAWFFYAALGTFGQQPNIIMVGKGSQSPITPCDVYAPDGIQQSNLIAWYVGKENAAKMAELREQAKEWLETWKENKSQGVGAKNAAQPEEAPFDDNMPF